MIIEKAQHRGFVWLTTINLLEVIKKSKGFTWLLQKTRKQTGHHRLGTARSGSNGEREKLAERKGVGSRWLAIHNNDQKKQNGSRVQSSSWNRASYDVTTDC